MGTGGTGIPWAALRNPVLAYPGEAACVDEAPDAAQGAWSIKDWACAFHAGTFYLFFSAFYADEGAIRSHVVEVSTRDWQRFSAPIMVLSGAEAGWAGMASPDVTRCGDLYYLTFNSWGDAPGRPNQLFYAVSSDLVHWSERRPLAANLTAGDRSIDAALAPVDDGARWYLAWKDRRHVTRIAVAPHPGADFALAGNGALTFETADGVSTSGKHENYQFVHVDGTWRLLATFYGAAHRPYLYEMAGDGKADAHWTRWVNGRELAVAEEGFNTLDRSNAAALYDWRALDGHFYLLYAGNTEKRTFRSSGGWGRGWNRLGLSRSLDLVRWAPAGMA